jgi:hypothetical protein
MDPTYSGLNRLALLPLPDDEKSKVITFAGKRTPALRLGGRAARFTSQAPFTDRHNIGYSRFDDKGSVLLANIDAVLNLTDHIGGYYAQGTQNNNLSFYSLLLEDHTLEMHSYIQWRRPLSISRVVMARVLGKPHLKTAQLDTLLKTDIPAIISLKPCDGYRIVGLISHGADSLTGVQTVTLKDLLTLALITLAVINSVEGKGFVVFPFRHDQQVSGTMTHESILDFVLFCTLIYKKVWCFRPYMCHELVCIAFSEPRHDPAKGSVDEQRLLGLWDALQLLPGLEKHTDPATVNPEIAKVAEVDMSEPTVEIPVMIKFDGNRNFSRIFDGSDVAKLKPKLADRVHEILTTPEDTALTRDRVEVLSRWQLPDSIDTVPYPF